LANLKPANRAVEKHQVSARPDTDTTLPVRFGL
jgi:hypothetical protein